MELYQGPFIQQTTRQSLDRDSFDKAVLQRRPDGTRIRQFFYSSWEAPVQLGGVLKIIETADGDLRIAIVPPEQLPKIFREEPKRDEKSQEGGELV